MVQRYKDKVVVVTGGSKGIGEGCVRVFARNGAQVVFCARDEKAGKSLEEEINNNNNGENGKVAFFKCDMTKEEDIISLMDFTIQTFGKLDCLVNNAGTHPQHKPIDEFSAQDFRNLLELNLVGYFIACKHALPHLRKTSGNIINMSSLVATMGQVGGVTYVATKGGINGLTNALAVDEAKHGVRVNTVSPGNVWTPLWESQVNSMEDPEKEKKAGADAQLLGRFGTMEEAGEACLFLASEGSFCTGINLPLSGGAELNYAFKNRINATGVY